MVYDAHKSDDEQRYQKLYDHLIDSSKLSEKFCSEFGFGEYGCISAKFHDVGKYTVKFQARLHGSKEKYEHSSAGMMIMYECYLKTKSIVPYIFAEIISGHHSGLPDIGGESDNEDEGTLWGKLNRRIELGNDYAAYREELGELPYIPPLPKSINNVYSIQFLGRMLFSSLCDADFLDTENFMSNGAVLRDKGDNILTLKSMFEAYMQQFKDCTGSINNKRSEILSEAVKAASGERGLYRLTVPTGGGKTLTSMAFALNHSLAQKVKMRRIIYVIPYTSIIKQTVDIFTKIFGEQNVLGHYSTAEVEASKDEERSQAELASENWDKPIIVTTNVQFFESLHSCKTSRCRKLHNIANSVLIFDEAQMLPTGLLRPCIRSITELVNLYSCTAVMCTATQPALDGLFTMPATEICSDVKGLYNFFKRVKYDYIGLQTDEYMTELINSKPSALCILNSRKGARKYYDNLKGDGVFYLTTYMTHYHIGKTLCKIRERLKKGERCIVISTSLVEAGVDMDFPYVFREESGLDSIIQAGGRCNRENKRAVNDSVVTIFKRTEQSQYVEKLVPITDRIIEQHKDISSPEAIKDYFERLYYMNKSETADKLDEKNFVKQLSDQKKLFVYRTVSENFKFIDNNQHQVFIPCNENKDIYNEIRDGKHSRNLMRKAAQYCVSLYNCEYCEFKKSGVLTDYGIISVLEKSDCYDSMTGLNVPITGEADFG